MDSNSKNPDDKPDLNDVLEDEPESKHATEGRAAHGGEQAGANSDEAGRTVAPQMGDHEGTDTEVASGG